MPKPSDEPFEILPEKIRQNFSYTLHFDWVLYPFDIQTRKAYTKMLKKVVMISDEESEIINNGLDKISEDIQNGDYQFKANQPDIHTAIEQALRDEIGDLASKINIGISKLDLISTDLRLWTKNEIDILQQLIKKFQKTILRHAKEHIKTYMPAYTDLQPTQTITVAHQLLAYMEMFQRDFDRLSALLNQLNVMPLGSSYGAGTTIPIDRIFLANSLGFSKISNNSIDAISDRDFLIEYLFCLSMIGQHMSRICADVILWTSEGFQFITLPEEFTEETLRTSKLRRSIVPELIRGKTSKLFSSLHTALVAVKGIPTHYTRDCQEDKEAAFEASDITQTSIEVLSRLFSTCTFNVEKINKAVHEHHWETLVLVEYLIKNDIPPDEAIKIIRTTLDYALDNNKKIEDLSLQEFQDIHKGFGQEVMLLLTPKGTIQSYACIGSSNPDRIQHEIEEWDSILG
ncbi:MAG: argininosuccinate lyase [Planctomycetota bacterium]|nr:MAG: argininosuccinate lyase [Planctomycetota bacterium]